MNGLKNFSQIFFVGCLLVVGLLGCGGRSSNHSAGLTVLSGSIGEDSDLVETLAKLPPDAAEAGIIVGLIDGDEEIIFVVGNSSFTEETLFEYGSITKVVTGIMLAQLAEEGKFLISDPLNDSLPPAMQAEKWETVTIQDVATHTSGLPRLPGNSTIDLFLRGTNPYSTYDTERLTYAMEDVEIENVGDEYAYSNFGFGILGAVVTEQGGESYSDLVKNRFFDPLGMETASIHGWTGETIAPPLLPSGKPSTNWDFDAMASAGAMRGSIRDGLVFLSASMQACESEDVLSRANCTAQQTTRTGDEITVGLAWHYSKDGRIIWHNGGTGGYTTFLGFEPDNGRGIVVLSNIATLKGLEEASADWLRSE